MARSIMLLACAHDCSSGFTDFCKSILSSTIFATAKLLSQAIMQIASNSPAFLILQSHKANRKALQFVGPAVHHLLQFGGTVTNRLLQQLAIVDIGTGAVPFNDASLLHLEWELREPETSGTQPSLERNLYSDSKLLPDLIDSAHSALIREMSSACT